MSEPSSSELVQSDPSAAPAVTPPVGFWRSVGQALRGEHFDYTAVSLNRAVLLLAVPMVLEMIMESIFLVVDVFFVGKLGADAITTVGVAESMMTILYAAAIGLSIGATATVARRIGEKDPDAAAHAGAQAILLGITFGAVVGVIGGVFAPQLLAAMEGKVVAKGAYNGRFKQ